MQRRKLLKQIGASTTLALGATGFASARQTDSLSDVKYVRTEVNGEVQEFTLDEFDQHPDTKSLSDIQCDCSYDCKECCDACCSGSLCCYADSCGSCPSC